MRRSEFDRAVADEFGAGAGSLVNDLVLASLDNLTAIQALDAGIAARTVWLTLCAETDVPPDRRYGVGRLEPRRG